MTVICTKQTPTLDKTGRKEAGRHGQVHSAHGKHGHVARAFIHAADEIAYDRAGHGQEHHERQCQITPHVTPPQYRPLATLRRNRISGTE